PQEVLRRRAGASEGDRFVGAVARPLRAVELRGHQRLEDRHAEVGLPRPRGHDEADRGPGGTRDEGGGRLPAGRQGAAQGGSPGVPARIHLRHQGRQAPHPRSGREREDAVPARLQVRRNLGDRRSVARRVLPRPRRGGGASTPIIGTELLTVRFGGLTALNGVNFEVGRGDIRAIIGPNGAGKSTFFNCLTGVLRPTSGRILFNGEDITGLPPDHISRKGIARSYQITNILPNATTLENVRIAAQSRRHGWDMLTHHGDFRDLIAKAQAVLKSVGLIDKAEEPAANLSHGEQRNLEIGIALATEPQLLCLDEPTAGMSTAETHDTMELVRRIAKNLTILIVEHDMRVVMELAQRITVLHYGEVLAEGTPADIQQNPRVQEVYLKT